MSWIKIKTTKNDIITVPKYFYEKIYKKCDGFELVVENKKTTKTPELKKEKKENIESETRKQRNEKSENESQGKDNKKINN